MGAAPGRGRVAADAHPQRGLPEPAREFATGWHVMLDALALAQDDEPTDTAWAAIGEVSGLYVE